jgi:cupin fold WbuC family metalloprotein
MPFHKSSDDRLQRMLSAIQPGSYIRPHRHVNPPKSESIVVLKGIICFVEFWESGDIGSVMVAGSALPLLGIDIDATVYHTYFALEPDTVLFEVKPGPYDEGSDKQFAPWAPAEGSVGCCEFAANIEELAKQSWS